MFGTRMVISMKTHLLSSKSFSRESSSSISFFSSLSGKTGVIFTNFFAFSSVFEWTCSMRGWTPADHVMHTLGNAISTPLQFTSCISSKESNRYSGRSRLSLLLWNTLLKSTPVILRIRLCTRSSVTPTAVPPARPAAVQ